jgi:hypothetical protein
MLYSTAFLQYNTVTGWLNWFCFYLFRFVFHRASGVRGLSTAAALATSKAASVKTVAVPGLKNGMEYARLGDSDLVVSKICMGTMTFGEVRYAVLL